MNDGLDLGPFYRAEFEITEDQSPQTVIMLDDGAEEVRLGAFLKDAAWSIRELGQGRYVLLILDADEWEGLLLSLARETAEDFLTLDEWAGLDDWPPVDELGRPLMEEYENYEQ